MGLDVDYIASKQAIESLEEIISSIEHGERKQIADDVIEFSKKMKEKYSSLSEYNVENIKVGQSTII